MLIAVLVVLILVAFVALLIVLFRQFTVREIAKNAAHLQALSQDYLKKQEELKQRIAEGDRHYREQLENTKMEIDRMKTQAVQEAEATRLQILAQARQESEQFIQKAMESKEALKRELEQAMQKRVVDLAQQLVRRTLSNELRQTIQSQWVDDLIDQGLSTLPALNSREQVTDVKVVSAVALTEAQRKRLQKRMTELAGGSITLAESVDPELIAGLTITFGHTVLDGSVRSRLDRAAREGKNGHG